MIVAAHQPHSLPWLGYLAKVAAADLFVVMDLENEPQNLQNGNGWKLKQGLKEHWQRKSWYRLRIRYGSTPYWKLYEPHLEEIYTRPWERHVELQLQLLRLHLRWFEIYTPVLRGSSLALRGQKTDRLESLCLAVGADVYLSGACDSRRHLDVEQLARSGVRVACHTFSHPIYPQRYQSLGLPPRLAALDLLFNCGPDAARLLRESIAPKQLAAEVTT